MNDGDVGIWCSLAQNVPVSIPLIVFHGSPLKGSADLVHGPGVRFSKDPKTSRARTLSRN